MILKAWWKPLLPLNGGNSRRRTNPDGRNTDRLVKSQLERTFASDQSDPLSAVAIFFLYEFKSFDYLSFDILGYYALTPLRRHSGAVGEPIYRCDTTHRNIRLILEDFRPEECQFKFKPVLLQVGPP